MARCRKPTRKHLSTTIDKALYDRLVARIKKEWDGPLSSWLDFAATCWLQESCDECPYAEEQGQQKVGIGQVAIKEEEK